MARVNYAQGKRQRELASKQKREEKAQRKAERSAQSQAEPEAQPEGAVETSENPEEVGDPGSV